MTDQALRRLQGLGWALVAAGLVALLVVVDRPEPAAWAILSSLGLMGAGGGLVGLRYILV